MIFIIIGMISAMASGLWHSLGGGDKRFRGDEVATAAWVRGNDLPILA